MRRALLVVALAVGVAACGASDNGGTIPVPGGSGSTASTTTSSTATSSTLPGGG